MEGLPLRVDCLADCVWRMLHFYSLHSCCGCPTGLTVSPQPNSADTVAGLNAARLAWWLRGGSRPRCELRQIADRKRFAGELQVHALALQGAGRRHALPELPIDSPPNFGARRTLARRNPYYSFLHIPIPFNRNAEPILLSPTSSRKWKGMIRRFLKMKMRGCCWTRPIIAANGVPKSQVSR
jgi:hypothetical protein